MCKTGKGNCKERALRRETEILKMDGKKRYEKERINYLRKERSANRQRKC